MFDKIKNALWYKTFSVADPLGRGFQIANPRAIPNITFTLNESANDDHPVFDGVDSADGNTLILSTPFDIEKTTCVRNTIASAMRCREDCMIVCDAADDEMKKAFAENGYTVHYFDPANPSSSDSWNPLKDLRSDTLVEDIDALARAIVKSWSDHEDLYTSSSACLLKALIIKTMINPDLTEDEKNLDTIYSILETPGCMGVLDQMFGSMSKTELEDAALQAYRAFRWSTTSSSLLGNIINHMVVQMKVLASDEGKHLLCENDFTVTKHDETPQAIFIVNSIANRQVMQWSAALISTVYQLSGYGTSTKRAFVFTNTFGPIDSITAKIVHASERGSHTIMFTASSRKLKALTGYAETDKITDVFDNIVLLKMRSRDDIKALLADKIGDIQVIKTSANGTVIEERPFINAAELIAYSEAYYIRYCKSHNDVKFWRQ